MNRQQVVVAVAAVVAAAATARLGWWQLDRAAQKQALQATLDERRAQPPLTAAELARDAAMAAAQQHRAVVLRGRWAQAATVYLENRQMRGRPGFFAVTPLVLADGTAVAVQRGWLPRDNDVRTRVAPHSTADGEVEVRGRIAPPPARLYEFAEGEGGAIRQNLRLDDWARETGLPLLLALSVVQTDAPGDGLLRAWPEPAAGIERHHGYAVQWFALSALIIGLYVWFQLIRPRRR
jgi:surfeit locus 1 family protein